MPLLYALLLALTTLGWGILFYKKDYHPQPVRVILKSFGVGLFSMVPVFAYQFLYRNFLPGLAEFRVFRPLLDSPLLMGLGVFLLNLCILSLVLFALGAAVGGVLNIFSHAALVNVRNALAQEPLGFTTVSLLIGAVIGLRQWGETAGLSMVAAGTLGTLLFLAIIEEYVKHLIVRINDDKEIRDIDDAITLSIMVGLAFAFVETLLYGLGSGEWKIVFFRTLVSVPIHVVASGLFGYYYGLAHFAEPLAAAEGRGKTGNKARLGSKRHGWLHRLLTFKKSTVYSEEKIIEGFLAATGFHALANMLFELNQGVWAVPLIMAGIAGLFRLYRKGEKENRWVVRWATRKRVKAW